MRHRFSTGTSHLTGVEVVDALEGQPSARALAHVASCEACQEELAALQDTLNTVGGADVPDPSALFWERLEMRVAGAIDTQARDSGHRARVWPWRWWLWMPAATVAGLLLVAALWHPMLPVRPENPTGLDHRASDVMAGDVAGDEIADADVLWSLLAAGSPDLEWDQVEEEGLGPALGAADRAVLMLTDEQRAELVRLLREELGTAAL